MMFACVRRVVWVASNRGVYGAYRCRVILHGRRVDRLHSPRPANGRVGAPS